MPLQYQQAKSINVRVYKWKKEQLIQKDFSGYSVLQCSITNETMLVQKNNKDFLEASRRCSVVNLDPVMGPLPCSHKCSYSTWYHLCFSLLATKGEGLIEQETASWLSQTISAYLVSNYQAVQKERDFRVVIAINVYLKTATDMFPELGSVFSFTKDDVTPAELLSNNYGLEQRKQNIGHVNDFLLETEEKLGVMDEFFESDMNSLLNLCPASGDEYTVIICILDWLVKEPHHFRLKEERELNYTLEEVKEEALKIKKFDAGCSKHAEENCAICMEELCEGDAVAVLPCSHTFHTNAIISWLALNSMECPTCRTVCPLII